MKTFWLFIYVLCGSIHETLHLFHLAVWQKKKVYYYPNPKENIGSTKTGAYNTVATLLQMLFAPFPAIYDASLEAIFLSKLDILVHL